METCETSETPVEEVEEKKEEEVKWFECYICKLKEKYDTKLNNPVFTPFIKFSAESYILKDPFTPAEKKQFFILGSDCCICTYPVCQSNECSIFYKKRYCYNCAKEKMNVFPQQLQSKIKVFK